jgi:molecular chaperone GrpE (heat shock protein)
MASVSRTVVAERSRPKMGDRQQRVENSADQRPEAAASATPGSAESPNEPQGVSMPSASVKPSSDLEALRQDVAGIRELIEMRLSRDRAKEEAFDRLYEELDRIKRHAAVLDNKPLYIDLMLLYDRMGVACEQATHASEEPGEVVRSLREELKEILTRRDLHLISTVDDCFDRRLQRAVSTEVCISQEQDGKVLRVLREGFSCGELVIRPQEVVIARYRPSPAADQPCGQSPNDKEEP